MNKNFQSAFESYVEGSSAVGVASLSNQILSTVDCTAAVLPDPESETPSTLIQLPSVTIATSHSGQLAESSLPKSSDVHSFSSRCIRKIPERSSNTIIRTRAQDMRLRFVGGSRRRKVPQLVSGTASFHVKSKPSPSPRKVRGFTAVAYGLKTRSSRCHDIKNIWSVRHHLSEHALHHHRVVVHLSRLNQMQTASSLGVLKSSEVLEAHKHDDVEKVPDIAEDQAAIDADNSPDKDACEDPASLRKDNVMVDHTGDKENGNGDIEMEVADHCDKGVATSDGQSKAAVERRPRRNVVQKKLDSAVGLSWREERDLKMALYASLHKHRPQRQQQVHCNSPVTSDVCRKVSTNSLQAEKTIERTCDVVVTSRPESLAQESGSSSVMSCNNTTPNTKFGPWQVRAQRKFASNGNSQCPTPEPKRHSSYVPRKLFPQNQKVTTEDFLTFLCLRGTTMLPANMEFFNHPEFSLLPSFPNTPQDSADDSRNSEVSGVDGEETASVMVSKQSVPSPAITDKTSSASSPLAGSRRRISTTSSSSSPSKPSSEVSSAAQTPDKLIPNPLNLSCHIVKAAKKKRKLPMSATYIKPRRKRHIGMKPLDRVHNASCYHISTGQVSSRLKADCDSGSVHPTIERTEAIPVSKSGTELIKTTRSHQHSAVDGVSAANSPKTDAPVSPNRPSTRSQTAAVNRHELVMAQMKSNEGVSGVSSYGDENRTATDTKHSGRCNTADVVLNSVSVLLSGSRVPESAAEVPAQVTVAACKMENRSPPAPLSEKPQHPDVAGSPGTVHSDRSMKRYLRKRVVDKHTDNNEFVARTFLRVPNIQLSLGRNHVRVGPTYQPSPELFQDPLGYINSVQGHACLDGICRVVPPLEGWKVESNLAESLVFISEVQHIHRFLQHSSESRHPTTSMQSRAVAEFKKIASSTFSELFPASSPSVDQVEKKYWKLVERGQPCHTVEMAHLDTQSCESAFPSSTDSPCSKHEWNFNILRQNPQSLLTHLGLISGLNVPMLHMGMLFSTSCWSRDQHSLPVIHYLHSGADIIWYCVAGHNEEKLKQALERLLLHPVDFSSPDWLTKHPIMVSPEKLAQSGVTVSRIVQRAGEFVVVFPQSFVANISCGYNVSESLSFAPASWLPLGCSSAQLLRQKCLPERFSIDQLLVAITRSSPDASSVLQPAASFVKLFLEEELNCRTEVVHLGMKNAGYLPDVLCRLNRYQIKRIVTQQPELNNELRRCHRCQKLCYLSMVLSERDGHIYCLHHATDIIHSAVTAFADFKLFIRCDEKELRDILATKLTATSASLAVALTHRRSQRRQPAVYDDK